MLAHYPTSTSRYKESPEVFTGPISNLAGVAQVHLCKVLDDRSYAARVWLAITGFRNSRQELLHRCLNSRSRLIPKEFVFD